MMQNEKKIRRLPCNVAGACALLSLFAAGAAVLAAGCIAASGLLLSLSRRLPLANGFKTQEGAHDRHERPRLADRRACSRHGGAVRAAVF